MAMQFLLFPVCQSRVVKKNGSKETVYFRLFGLLKEKRQTSLRKAGHTFTIDLTTSVYLLDGKLAQQYLSFLCQSFKQPVQLFLIYIKSLWLALRKMAGHTRKIEILKLCLKNIAFRFLLSKMLFRFSENIKYFRNYQNNQNTCTAFCPIMQKILGAW